LLVRCGPSINELSLRNEDLSATIIVFEKSLITLSLTITNFFKIKPLTFVLIVVKRSTEEIFALFISMAFAVDAFKDVVYGRYGI